MMLWNRRDAVQFQIIHLKMQVLLQVIIDGLKLEGVQHSRLEITQEINRISSDMNYKFVLLII